MTAKLDVRVEAEFEINGKKSSSMDPVRDMLKKLVGKLDRAQMGDLLGEIGEIYYTNTMDRFRSHTDPKGRSWKWLQPKTIKLKTTGIVGKGGKTHRPPAVKAVSPRIGSAIQGGPYNQLIWTGKMVRAIRIVKDARRGSVNIGLSSTEIPYAWRHQMGYGKVPMRKFLGYNQATNARAMEAVARYVSQAISTGV